MRITTNKQMTIETASKIKQFAEEWNIKESIKEDAEMMAMAVCFSNGLQHQQLIKVESAEYTTNRGWRKDGDSLPTLTVWITIVVETRHNEFKRIGFDYVDAMLYCSEQNTISSYVYEAY